MGVPSVSRFGISVMAIAILLISGQTSAASYKFTDLRPGTASFISDDFQL